jgi:cytochrome c peroxidase
MNNAVSWVLVLFLTVTLLNNCLQNTTHQEIKKKQSFIDQLRIAYSSGDISKWPKPILDPSKPAFTEIGHCFYSYYLFLQHSYLFNWQIQKN